MWKSMKKEGSRNSMTAPHVSSLTAPPPTIGVETPGVFLEEHVSSRTFGQFPTGIVDPHSEIDRDLDVEIVLVKLDVLD